jgi:hypothetical protein
MDTCEWVGTYDEYETTWEGSCGAEFILLEGTPAENGMKYCPNCGRKLTQRVPDADNLPAEEVAE